jgi:hypothetical protein
VAPLGNRLPRRVTEALYAMAGRMEGLPPRHLGQVRMEEADQWVIDQYPQPRYPAVLIGSSGGAAVHLAAAMGAPFIPQTLLVPVRRDAADVDDLTAAMEWGRRTAPPLLEANPDHVLHQAHDPSQDRLMARHIGYFRLKRQRLGPLLERFLATRLTPGATVFVLDCRTRWPVTRVGPRHVFQAGGAGSLTPEEYIYGGPRVAAFLRRRGRPRLSFKTPTANERAAEAEWGFDAALMEDLQRIARQLGLRVQHVPYDEPQGLSATVADLYRSWYARLGRPTWRLLAESFVLTEPTWALRTSSVPYWCVFPVEPAAQALEDYLLNTPGFREIYTLLFSYGLHAEGTAPTARWRDLIDRVGRGELVSVDARAYPRDLASIVQYQRALERSVADRYPWPAPLDADEVACFLAERAAREPTAPRSGNGAP